MNLPRTALCGALVSLIAVAGCGEDTVAFRVILDDRACGAKSGAPIELSLSALEADGSRLCLLNEMSFGAGSAPTLETGPEPGFEEVVLLAAVRSGGCLSCYGLLRVLLKPDLTTFTLALRAAPGCAIPETARAGLALPAGPLPPTESCR